MPAAEITAAVTSIRAAYDLTKAMISIRDTDLLAEKSRELNALMLDILEKGIGAREAQASQLDEIRSLKAEIADLKAWDAEKQRYELKSIGTAAPVYVLKPEERGTAPPHWLCPNCFGQNKKSFFQSTREMQNGHLIFRCVGCKAAIAVSHNTKDWPA